MIVFLYMAPSAYANGALAPEYELISRIIKVRTEKKMIQKQRA